MSMPHPRMMTSPIGCVAVLRTTKVGPQVDITYDEDQIKALHPAFTAQLAHDIVATEWLTADKTYQAFNIAASVTGSKSSLPTNYNVWSLNANDPNAKVVKIGPAELEMEPNFYYWLLPTNYRIRSGR